MAEVNLTQLVNKLLAILTPREREVIEKRGGLKDGRVLTLAEVGNGYGITRERVRQIEASALAKLKSAAKKGELNAFLAVVDGHLKAVGGLRRESLLVDDLHFLLRDSSNTLGNKARFLMELSDDFSYVPEDNTFYGYWYASKDIRQKAVTFVTRLAKFLEGKKSELISDPKDVNEVIKGVATALSLKDAVALNYVATSKLFHVNQFGDFGLADWSEVNPRTVRHWAHLVLRKDRKPLHFTEIANRINQVKKGAVKAVNHQTVHNELIKDGRFVLVGRGMYGLQEFGLMPGTAREVIGRILKTHGPMKPKDLVTQVKKERVFKDNTIFINLQNKKHFVRLPDGRYSVKEA